MVSAAVLVMVLFGDTLSAGLTHAVVRASGDALDQRMKRLAGRSSVNCGTVPVRGDAATATRCALEAQAKARPFHVRYNIMGIDSAVAGAIVRTQDGKLYSLSFDGDPMGGGGVSLTRQQVYEQPCPVPYHLYVNPKGRINCFQQQLSPPKNLMSPNFEPY